VRVAVTGSAGKIGREAMVALREAGHRPVGFDLRPGPDGFRTVTVDCTDYGEVLGALAGVDAVGGIPDAVVHLAAVPAPGLAPDHVVFGGNTAGVHHVFTACARLGIRRVVWASSETVLGLPFTVPPDFLPIDESHPDRPEYHYALSKMLGEQMADTFCRWDPGMTIVSLRFSNVYAEVDYESLAAIQARPDLRKANLWGYVDAADAGQACARAVDAEVNGHHRLIVAAADSLFDVPSAELARTYFPETPVTSAIEGNRSLLSSDRARELVGYRPQFSWRDRVRSRLASRAGE